MTPDSGAPTSADADRVRLCLQCGEMVAFDVRVCPACGHFEPAAPDARGASRSCGACARRVAADAVFCPHCGDETGLVPPASALPASRLRQAGASETADGDVPPPDASVTDGDASVGLEGALVALLAVAGPLLLLAAALASARGAQAG